MLTLNYFASIREALGRETEQYDMPDSVSTVASLIEHLVDSNGGQSSILAQQDKTLVAVNQTIVDRSCRLQGDEEIAFFPPMTGG